MTTARPADLATRDRLLAAASKLFAERGFAKVTVRDICRQAKANVAAVNYHFGDKEGLYARVLQSAIGTMRETTEVARKAGENVPPDQQLREYVHVFVHRVIGGGHRTWIHQLMMHEMQNPTPALDLVVEQVIKPRMAYLCGIVAALLGAEVDDERVIRCALSVHAQCLALMRNPVAEMLAPGAKYTREDLSAIADHITRFSLAGIRAYGAI